MINLAYDTLNRDIVIGWGSTLPYLENKKGFMIDNGQEIIHYRILSRLYDGVTSIKVMAIIWKG